MDPTNPPKSNAGIWAAVGAVAAIGGVVAVAAIGSGGKKAPAGGGMNGASRGRFVKKKPCGCGR